MSEEKQDHLKDIILFIFSGACVFFCGMILGIHIEKSRWPDRPPGMKIVWEAKLVEDKH